MKRLILISGIISINLNLIFGLSGTGTKGNPYIGIITSNTTWNPDTYIDRTIYAQNITVASGVTLTITPSSLNGGEILFSPYSPTNTLTINSGATVIINPGIGVSVLRIINDGSLILESYSDEVGVSSLIHDSYSGGGTTQVRLSLSGGMAVGNAYLWHYIAMPISGIRVSEFNTQNLVQYIESLVIGADNSPGWVASDGYQYSSGNVLTYQFNTLSLGKGYNYYHDEAQTFTFTGIINTYEYSENINLTAGSGYPDYQGYNLIGNPFAACLDWNYMVNNYTGDISDAIYFTNRGTISSYVNGIGDNGGTGTIPPMQGFFVKANSNTYLIFPRAARVHKTTQLRYKKGSDEFSKSTDTISFVRLKMHNTLDSTDLIIRFNQKATSGVDKAFDAYEFSRTSGDINIWTSIGMVDYSINGLPFPEEKLEIPVGVHTNVSGTFLLYSDEINNLDGYSISLKDNITGKMADLKRGESCEFTSQTGSTENRFIIVITKSATAVQNITDSNESFTVYKSGDAVNIRYDGEGPTQINGSVTVYDISGKVLIKLTDLEWSGKGDYKQVFLESVSPGIYLLEVKTETFRSIERIGL